MDNYQEPNFKKQRTMLEVEGGETGQERTTANKQRALLEVGGGETGRERTTANKQRALLEVGGGETGRERPTENGPEGDSVFVPNSNDCRISPEPGFSGDRALSCGTNRASALSSPTPLDSHRNSPYASSAVNLNTVTDAAQRTMCGKTDKHKFDKDTCRDFIWEKSTAIAENVYIKNKECEKICGESVKSGPDVRLWNVWSETDLPQESLGGEHSEDAHKIIAFDRGDFEFDFYGRAMRDEEDGMLISPPDHLSDTGFIEMFSNSVMGSVMNSNGNGSRLSPKQQLSGVLTQTSLETSNVAGPSYQQVKLANVPFFLDSDYMDSVLSQQNINNLPQSLLIHVFKWLSPCSLLRRAGLVCKYWYNLCRDKDLWREITLKNQYKLSDVALVQLLEFSDRVLKVNLNDCRFVSDVGVHRLVSKCQHLQSLKLIRCFDLTDSSFAGMGSQGWCRQLHTLFLDGCCKITDNTAVEISEACTNITSLHLNQCSKITDAGVISLASRCHKITQLLLDHCSRVTDRGLTELVLGCPNITYLNIMSCGVTDAGIKMLAKLQHLTNLDVSNIPLLTPASVVHISRHCRKLDCINVSLNCVIDDKCVAELAKNLPSLLRLYCVSCSVTDKGLKEIAVHRPTLEALDVGWCQDVTDQGVRDISMACWNLDYLGLIRCDKVTIETIEELVLRFPTVNYSTFILESRRLLERARREGYQFGL